MEFLVWAILSLIFVMLAIICVMMSGAFFIVAIYSTKTASIHRWSRIINVKNMEEYNDNTDKGVPDTMCNYLSHTTLIASDDINTFRNHERGEIFTRLFVCVGCIAVLNTLFAYFCYLRV